jgi:hypothetical protein
MLMERDSHMYMCDIFFKSDRDNLNQDLIFFSIFKAKNLIY